MNFSEDDICKQNNENLLTHDGLIHTASNRRIHTSQMEITVTL